MENTIQCLLTRKFWDRDINYLKKNVASDVEFVFPDEYSTEGLIRKLFDNKIKIMLGDVPDEKVLNAAKYLELIQIPWNGVEGLDFHLLEKFDFTVCNSHSNSISVAELAIGLMFSCIKQIPSHDKALRKGNWRRPGAADCEFPDLLYGKTVAIVGFGSVGQTIFKMLSGFNLTFIAVALHNKKFNGVPVFGPDKIHEVCSKADIIFISAPLTKKTYGLVNQNVFKSMKPRAYLINVGRAEIIEEESLYRALKNKVIAGAAIDTWYVQPSRGVSISPVSRFVFNKLDNLVMSPHRGGMIRDELLHLNDVVENLNRFANGDNLINVINIKEGY